MNFDAVYYNQKGAIMATTQTVKMMMVAASLIIAAVTAVAGTKTVVGLTDAEIAVITEQTTRALSSILINVASMEQGVRHYDLKKNFAYDLTDTHIRLTYIGKTHTSADELETEHTSAVRHYQKNIKPHSVAEGAERICISKKIVNCKPEITICNEGEECCTIEENPCKLIQ